MVIEGRAPDCACRKLASMHRTSIYHDDLKYEEDAVQWVFEKKPRSWSRNRTHSKEISPQRNS